MTDSKGWDLDETMYPWSKPTHKNRAGTSSLLESATNKTIAEMAGLAETDPAGCKRLISQMDSVLCKAVIMGLLDERRELLAISKDHERRKRLSPSLDWDVHGILLPRSPFISRLFPQESSMLGYKRDDITAASELSAKLKKEWKVVATIGSVRPEYKHIREVSWTEQSLFASEPDAPLCVGENPLDHHNGNQTRLFVSDSPIADSTSHEVFKNATLPPPPCRTGLGDKISSQLLLYRLMALFRAPPDVDDSPEQCPNENWGFLLFLRHGHGCMAFTDDCGRPRVMFRGSEEASEKALELLNYLTGKLLPQIWWPNMPIHPDYFLPLLREDFAAVTLNRGNSDVDDSDPWNGFGP